MRVRVFRDRPHAQAVRFIAYFRDAHVFLFHWGITIRHRRHGGAWRHWTAFYKPRPMERGRGGTLTFGTWMTSNGVTDRVAKSKKYVLLKVLG